MNTAEIAMSVRSTNIHKKDNDTRLNTIINTLFDQYIENQHSNLE
ncbi:MAG: hypothetical protein Nk1A_7930 [Endomicrobiia bacterium]|nr:MAG: hypothetical protein Nk1A_7930 [Endomicrobiia bacterium]